MDLHVSDTGHGPPLLLLHGLTGTHDDFRHLFDLDALRARFRVLSPDARGHGRSPDPGGPFSFAACARDVLALLDRLGIARVRAVGVSLGAQTLLHVATLAPERVERMILVSASARLPEATCALLRQASAQEHTEAEWAAMRTRHVLGDAQIERLWRLPAQLADDAAGHDFGRDALGRIGARTMVVSGDRDPFYPVELAVELYRGVPGASLLVVPEGLHSPVFLGEREGFEARALPFLGVPPGGPPRAA